LLVEFHEKYEEVGRILNSATFNSEQLRKQQEVSLRTSIIGSLEKDPMDSPLEELTGSSLLPLDCPSHDLSSFLGTFGEGYPAGIETNIIASARQPMEALLIPLFFNGRFDYFNHHLGGCP
jgi:hypothetical protein